MSVGFIGTYYGQWLRGVRHGYGVRQSVSYEIAVRYPTHTAFANVSIPVPGPAPPPLPEKEDDLLLRERDLRIEESRGGFVLRARTVPAQQDTASGKHRMVLDKYGKPSIRKTIVKVWASSYTYSTVGVSLSEMHRIIPSCCNTPSLCCSNCNLDL